MPLSEIAFDDLDLSENPGVGLELVFESDDLIMFYGDFGLFGYNLKSREITFAIDFVKTFGRKGSVQGQYVTGVEASSDGREIVFVDTDPDHPDDVKEAYFVDVPTLTYTCGAYRPIENAFLRENAVGYARPGGSIITTVYIRGDQQWHLFDGYPDAFQTFLEKWKLSGLVHQGLEMTAADQDAFIKYFDKFDHVTRNYLLLLLQKIAAGEPTPTDPYNDPQYGVYLNFCRYLLYDMNQDGFPEFVLETGGAEADRWYTIYTIVDGKLVDCGGFTGSHTVLYTNGSGQLLRYASHMGSYHISLTAMNGTTLVTKEIAEGELDSSKGESYPELKDYGYEGYGQLPEFSDTGTIFLAPKG